MRKIKRTSKELELINSEKINAEQTTQILQLLASTGKTDEDKWNLVYEYTQKRDDKLSDMKKIEAEKLIEYLNGLSQISI